MDSSSSNTIGDLIIPLEDIVSATNNFSDENLIRRGGFGKVYKGQLRRSGQLIDIVARRLDPKYRKGEKEFFMEVEVLSTLKHENLATLIGFCDDKGEMIIINKLEPRGSLDKYLRDPTLTWMRRLEICVGVADALSYIHYDKGRDFSIIHRNIKSSKVLLDDKWKPKLSGFELSMKNTTARRHRLLSDDLCGTIGYIDPTYEKTGGVNHKSDVYSFGVVLFEVLCGRRAFNNTRSEGLSAQLDHVVVGNSDTMVDRPPELATDGVSDVDMRMFTLLPSSRFHYEERLGHLRIPDEQLLAPLAISHYEEKTLYDLIDPDLWKQMDPVSFSVFSKTAYDCLKEQRSDRPNIDEIVIRLREALDLQRKREKSGIPNEHSQVAGEVEGTLTNRLEWKKLEHLKMSYHDIKVATKNFSENCIGSGGFGKVYRAELEYFDTENSLETKEKNKHDLPKIRNTVAIKCLFKRKDTQAEKGFAAEIEILSSCKHPNVVSLIGFCDEKASDLILVYKYASNGSLDDHLRSFVKMTNLKWEQRLQLCLDIARGLNYLHTKQNIIHRDIKSDNILLDDNMVAKIADFGLSKIGPVPQHASYIETTVAGTIVYLDPEYEITQKLKKASDIYSLGVVLFEILSGSLAYNKAYMDKNPKGLAPCVRQHFQNGTLKDMVDPKLKGNLDENNLISTKGPNQDSLETFLDIAYQCIAETQTQRPKIGTVVKKLKSALQLQIEHEHLQISLEDIKEATNNFSIKNCIRGGGFGNIYIGEAIRADGSLITFAAKRLDSSYGEGETEFLTELEILLEYKHKNVIGLIGYCRQAHEKIIVYEYAPKGSLARHLANKDLTWRMRLEICIDIARGLEFLHGGGVTQEAMMHRDIKSSNILLGDDWKAKISDFGLSVIVSDSGDVIDKVCGTKGYCDPQYLQEGVFTKASDIYSFGVLLFEILCGILMFKITNGRIKILIDKFKRYYIKGKLDDMIFEGIKEQIVPQSLSAFQELANECVDDLRHKRPTTGEVLLRLEHSLHLQEDYGIWLPKLPSNYEEIFKMSSISETYFTKTKKDLHSMLSRGILLQKDQVLFSLGDNGETNEMISAQKFLYKHRQSRKWQSIPEESRFSKVAKMLDLSNLKIRIKIRAQFLARGVNYGVHLVFKFCTPQKSQAKRMYVNLKYKMGSESLQAYFATRRENGWMMTELCRFLNDKEDTDFEFLLESLSRCYCGSRAIYVQGIEFRAIEKLKDEEMDVLKNARKVLKSDLNMDQLEKLPTYRDEISNVFKHNDGEDMFSLVNGKKYFMLSEKAAPCTYPNAILFEMKPSTQSSIREEIELLPQQVYRIHCMINGAWLSEDTDYMCYLVFKISGKSSGLHCPVKVRDLLHRKKKEDEIIYFTCPTPWNLHDPNQAPKQREDGWMEVKVWKLNSKHGLKNDHLHVNLKLISYQGTMSGLIISGLEFRAI